MRGRAIGVDLWRADQTGNSPTATLANAELEKVADRVEIRTADMTALPFADESIDVIVSYFGHREEAGLSARGRAMCVGSERYRMRYRF